VGPAPQVTAASGHFHALLRVRDRRGVPFPPRRALLNFSRAPDPAARRSCCLSLKDDRCCDRASVDQPPARGSRHAWRGQPDTCTRLLMSSQLLHSVQHEIGRKRLRPGVFEGRSTGCRGWAQIRSSRLLVTESVVVPQGNHLSTLDTGFHSGYSWLLGDSRCARR